eukprot:TRINITY_DN6054_c0_g1_i2.p2 TRINITY_DN6054_c0_g1~~TRINITY_DN6054_c0_g1_i2.p2  ORF type:complete len:113 (+),score=26.67 TRINITY_DN6054_c0_g1_i2:45-383(+)
MLTLNFVAVNTLREFQKINADILNKDYTLPELRNQIVLGHMELEDEVVFDLKEVKMCVTTADALINKLRKWGFGGTVSRLIPIVVMVAGVAYYVCADCEEAICQSVCWWDSE